MTVTKRISMLLIATAMWIQGGCEHSLVNSEKKQGCEGPAGHWQLLGLENETVTAIGLHPKEYHIIYAGTQFDFSAGVQGKLFKSTDCESTWDTLIVAEVTEL